jgi:hypothetical protein
MARAAHNNAWRRLGDLRCALSEAESIDGKAREGGAMVRLHRDDRTKSKHERVRLDNALAEVEAGDEAAREGEAMARLWHENNEA